MVMDAWCLAFNSEMILILFGFCGMSWCSSKVKVTEGCMHNAQIDINSVPEELTKNQMKMQTKWKSSPPRTDECALTFTIWNTNS